MPSMRLHKYIAQCSNLSRRAAEKAIASGEVTVNGVTVTSMGQTIVQGKDKVALLGRNLSVGVQRHYLMFYKPKRTVVTKSDPQGRSTIWDRIPQKHSRLNTVGRLDYDSEGLLLLTDDGDLLNGLTHPSHAVAKKYQVKVKGQLTPAAFDRLIEGMIEAGERLEAKSVRRLATKPTARSVKSKGDETKHMWLEIILHSGKYRQIRRMCELVGHPVLKLKRVAVGPVQLGDLKPGKTRNLSSTELKSLQALVR